MVGPPSVAAGTVLILLVVVVVVARSMKGNGMRPASGTATGEPGCPTGMCTRGATNTERDMARSDSVAGVAGFLRLTLYAGER